jgi:hypothetical protein
MTVDDILLDIQRQIFESKGIRTDIHYKQGKGVLVVPENAPLHPNNVMLSIPEIFLFTGNNLTINF